MATKIFLTSGTSWTVPGDWNPGSNTIECIGGGAGGKSNGGGGGGGGAYSKVSNLSLTGSVTYQIGDGGGVNVAGSDTWFNGASLAASSVGAKGGSLGIATAGGVGGLASAGTGTTKYNGGTGGSWPLSRWWWWWGSRSKWCRGKRY